METKVCSKCKIEKPKSEFFKSGKQKSGKSKARGDCKVCSKKETMNWRIKNKSEYNSYMAQWRAKNPGRTHITSIKHHYGLSIEEYDRMLVEQDYRCKICSKKHAPHIPRGRLYVDHCHATSKVRGLLCGKCNVALGALDDNISLLQKAISYLQSN